MKYTFRRLVQCPSRSNTINERVRVLMSVLKFFNNFRFTTHGIGSYKNRGFSRERTRGRVRERETAINTPLLFVTRLSQACFTPRTNSRREHVAVRTSTRWAPHQARQSVLSYYRYGVLDISTIKIYERKKSAALRFNSPCALSWESYYSRLLTLKCPSEGEKKRVDRKLNRKGVTACCSNVSHGFSS